MSNYSKVDEDEVDQEQKATTVHYIPSHYPPEYATNVIMNDADDGLSPLGSPPGYQRSLKELYSNTFTLVSGRPLFWAKLILPGLSVMFVSQLLLLVVVVAIMVAAAADMDLDKSRGVMSAATSFAPMISSLSSFTGNSYNGRSLEDADMEDVRKIFEEWGFVTTYMILFGIFTLMTICLLLAITLIRTPLIYAMNAFHLKTAPSIDFSTTFKLANRRYCITLGTTLLSSLIILCGYLLFFIPGIIFSVMYALAYVVPVLEQRGVMDSLRQARNLTRGQFWRTFAFLGSLKITMILITLFVRFIFGLIGVAFVEVLMLSLVNLFEQMFMCAGLVVFYNDLCARRPADRGAIQL